MSFQPSNTLRSRTFIGLLVAQFLAAFNDQCIHASAMFFAIRHETLTRTWAISLMPILFYAPWAIFATLAGYFADRYSKRSSLVLWKFAEIGITLVALTGFLLGSHYHMSIGPWIVLSTVFLMGTHSAFFVPAKYGAMPEILQPTLLSKGNGILESTSFLAVILGTVSGGLLYHAFRDGHEYVIGLILVALAVIGAGASSLIERMPAANPGRLFPVNLFKPLLDNLRIMLRSRPLALSVLGIAFFTFVVAFMRATMYMHGESQIPKWSEFQTSWVVATVALGVGLGSPLAGFLSGGKVELGLVPLGAIGMIVASLVAAYVLSSLTWLVVCLVLIGFFSGFYIVPLYTLLQHRAPKASKGDLVATSNFTNVTGAIAASLLFFALVFAAKSAGLARSVPQEDVAVGELTKLYKYRLSGHVAYIAVQQPDGKLFRAGEVPPYALREGLEPGPDRGEQQPFVIEMDEGLKKGSQVAVSQWKAAPHGIPPYEVRSADDPLEDAYDTEDVPKFLFIGAGLMTLGILILLCRRLPDFFVRALLWLRSWGRYRLKVIGGNNVPSDGAVILATNCERVESCMQVLSATDRFTRFILLENGRHDRLPPLLRLLAKRTSVAVLQVGTATEACWTKALQKAVEVLDEGEIVGLPTTDGASAPEMDRFLRDLQMRKPTQVLPIYCSIEGSEGMPRDRKHWIKHVRVVIGKTLPAETPAEVIHQEIHRLAEQVSPVEKEG